MTDLDLIRAGRDLGICDACGEAFTWAGKGKRKKLVCGCHTEPPEAVSLVTASRLPKAKVSAKGRKRKGAAGEREVRKLLENIGLDCKAQPSSGAFGTRINESAFVGDLAYPLNGERRRVEVKRRATEPKVFVGWLQDCHELWLRADNGEWFVFQRATNYLPVLAAAKENS